jgi:hypothetical protein
MPGVEGLAVGTEPGPAGNGRGPTLALHPDHQADLERSGLTAATIAAAGIRSLAPAEWAWYVGAARAGRLTSAYLLPYSGTDDFYRVKLFPPLPDGAGHTVRYVQPAGSTPRLYIPPQAQAALTDPSVALRITEGEKKALKADQERLPCLGLGGLWNWRHAERPITDLDTIDWVERPVILTPDSDVWTRPELLKAVYALGRELETRGATVTVEKLPAGPDGGKVGLDDFLCAHSVEALMALPKIELKHRAFTQTATWWKEWRARKAERVTPPAADIVALLERGESARPLHPAQDVVDAVLLYGLPIDDQLVILTSRRTGHRADTLPAGWTLRHKEPGPSSMSRDAALRWLSGTATGSVAQALDGLTGFFGRYVIFRDARTPIWLAAWALGTWGYRAFRIFPYLAIRSPEKRCGKSRLLGLLRGVCFNAGPVSAHPTEATLFRDAASTGGTQLFDEVESLRGDRDRFEALISVLNVGFERGGVVSRAEKRGDERFVSVRYEVYAPRALAGIRGLKDTLEDRSLPCFMARRRRDEPIARVTRATEGEATALRETAAFALLTRVGDILQAYEEAPALLEREGVDDRAVDLWAPLIALAVVADAEEEADRRTRTLLGVAREFGGLRDAEADTGQTTRLVAALDTIRAARGEFVKPADLLAGLQTELGWERLKSPAALARLVNPLGLVRTRRRVDGKLAWGFPLEADVLADLRARYGASDLEPLESVEEAP